MFSCGFVPRPFCCNFSFESLPLVDEGVEIPNRPKRESQAIRAKSHFSSLLPKDTGKSRKGNTVATVEQGSQIFPSG